MVDFSSHSVGNGNGNSEINNKNYRSDLNDNSDGSGVKPFRTRFAPSPTGDLHIGGARTALFSYLSARHAGGEFILRVEDTDLERSTESSIRAILEGMDWLNLDYDEGPYFQTKRFPAYKAVADKLVSAGSAYYCECSKDRLDEVREAQMSRGEKPRYDHRCRDLNLTSGPNHVIRFKNPLEGEVIWDDLVKGPIKISNQELDDMIIWRSDQSPTYNFTVVVDDLEMGITHVIRGDDHVNNTPRQINIFKALGARCPLFAHVSMILGEDGKKLSKRHGAASVMAYRNLGYLPEALLNYLVRMGWSYGDQEIFTREEMIKYFNISAVNNAPAAMNLSKLNWLNQHYLKTLPIEKLRPELEYHIKQSGLDTRGGPDLGDLIYLFSDRVHTLVELMNSVKYFYQDFELSQMDPVAVGKFLKPEAKAVLNLLWEKLNLLEESIWTAEKIHEVLNQVASELNIGMGKVGMPLRVAITGGSQSPAIDETARWLGKTKVLARIKKVL